MTAEPTPPQSPLSALLSAAARVEEMDNKLSLCHLEATDAAFCARLREDYPDKAHMGDEELVEYFAHGWRYATTWDHIGDAYEDFEPLADYAIEARTLLPAFARAAALLAGALEKIKTGIRENGNDTVWVGPGCTAEDAIDAALASAARLVAEVGVAKGDGKEGGR